jgi:hypothetical protein
MSGEEEEAAGRASGVKTLCGVFKNKLRALSAETREYLAREHGLTFQRTTVIATAAILGGIGASVIGGPIIGIVCGLLIGGVLYLVLRTKHSQKVVSLKEVQQQQQQQTPDCGDVKHDATTEELKMKQQALFELEEMILEPLRREIASLQCQPPCAEAEGEAAEDSSDDIPGLFLAANSPPIQNKVQQQQQQEEVKEGERTAAMKLLALQRTVVKKWRIFVEKNKLQRAILSKASTESSVPVSDHAPSPSSDEDAFVLV